MTALEYESGDKAETAINWERASQDWGEKKAQQFAEGFLVLLQ